MAESILDAPEEQLKKAQAKITYLGSQTKPIPTVVFSSEGHEILLSHFVLVHRAHKPYPNDELRYTKQFGVTPAEFHRMLAAVKSLVTRADAAQGPALLSFCVVRGTDTGVEGHEFRIGPASSKEFYEKLINALEPGNQRGREILSTQFANVFPQ